MQTAVTDIQEDATRGYANKRLGGFADGLCILTDWCFEVLIASRPRLAVPRHCYPVAKASSPFPS
jgi:hypothetical protein